jgi:hypothetical protein
VKPAKAALAATCVGVRSNAIAMRWLKLGLIGTDHARNMRTKDLI